MIATFFEQSENGVGVAGKTKAVLALVAYLKLFGAQLKTEKGGSSNREAAAFSLPRFLSPQDFTMGG